MLELDIEFEEGSGGALASYCMRKFGKRFGFPAYEGT